MLNLNAMRIKKSCLPQQHFDIIAIIEAPTHGDLLIDHRLSTATEISKTDLQINPQLLEHWGRVDIHQTINGRSKGLTGNRPQMSTRAANLRHSLDGTNALTLLGRFHSGSFAAGASPNHEHIKMFFWRSLHRESHLKKNDPGEHSNQNQQWTKEL